MLARALMKKRSKILLLDETFSALDVHTRQRVLDNLYRFSKDRTTIIISNIFEVVAAADHVIVLHRGRVIFEGSPEHLSRERSLYTMILNQN